MTTAHVPAGRAGRQWLRHRLDIAEHGAELLEKKLGALTAHRALLAERAGSAAAEWAERVHAAQAWQLRAAMAGGRRGIRLAEPADHAAVTFDWATVMGVRYPREATVTAPSSGDTATAIGGAAVVRTRQAFREALDTAAGYAALTAAVRIVDTEITTTRQRVRSLRRRWIPRLQAALAQRELELEEQERAEAIRHRWAHQKGQ